MIGLDRHPRDRDNACELVPMRPPNVSHYLIGFEPRIRIRTRPLLATRGSSLVCFQFQIKPRKSGTNTERRRWLTRLEFIQVHIGVVVVLVVVVLVVDVDARVTAP